MTIKETMRTIIRASIVLFAVSVALGAHAADFAIRTYPLSLDIEGRYFQSSIFLRLQVRDYNLPFAEFAKGERDPYERAFATFITALRDDDTVTASKMLAPTLHAASGTTAALLKSDRTPAQLVTAYRAVFGGMKDIVVDAEVLNGTKHLFIWHSASAATPIRRAFAVDGDIDSLAVHEVTSADPVSVIIMDNVMEAMRVAPAAYKSLASRATKFEYALPVRGAEPVVMQFNGSVLDVTPLGARTASSSADVADVLRIYADTAESLRLHAIDQFLAHFTPESAKKIKALVDALPEAAYNSVYDLSWQVKHIRLVAGSDPVYVVFYTLSDPNKFKYDYLVRDPATNKLLFANVARHGLADDVFGRPELFDPARVIGQQAPATR